MELEMMHEQIFLGGAPVVGFGDGASSPPLSKELVGTLVGATAGAVLGGFVGKGVGIAIGAVVGGLGGALVGTAVAKATPNNPPPPWQRISIVDIAKLKTGQQLAIAVVAPNGAPFPPEEIAAINAQFTALATAPVNLPFKNFVQYPPGAKLPLDWPVDDDLGTNAYRISEELITDAPPEAAKLKDLTPSLGTVKAWARIGNIAAITQPTPPATGEVYGIGLSGIPATATVEDVGRALAQAMAWNMDTIEDGSLDRLGPVGWQDNLVEAMLTIGFKANTKTPALPSVGFSFKVGAAYVTVTSVTRAPVKIQ